jgi:hypothetical protein
MTIIIGVAGNGQPGGSRPAQLTQPVVAEPKLMTSQPAGEKRKRHWQSMT